MPDRLAVRARSRRAFSSSDRVSFGTSSLESTRRCVVLSFMLYSHRSSWNWLSARPRRKVTRSPSGDTRRLRTPGPASDGSAWMRSSVRRSADGGRGRQCGQEAEEKAHGLSLVEVNLTATARRYQSRPAKSCNYVSRTTCQRFRRTARGCAARQPLQRPGQQHRRNRQPQHQADPEAGGLHRRGGRPREPVRRQPQHAAQRQREAPERHQLDHASAGASPCSRGWPTAVATWVASDSWNSAANSSRCAHSCLHRRVGGVGARDLPAEQRR